ncbi:uncharacterized protein CLUP02_03309 [Colletotrichum lupini]|uniref:Uncharacterized protein n=1 Tax=Colletotrichum lupini TaxID=145971 RepID=A0A9Q8SJW1_9PEZI|nr:uncharacterized protein CLUP02_03309 [Colletotrichum lupini]UQC77837.1 hypothetical protein CLUP02_03309 [Colletotrichum lupini]
MAEARVNLVSRAVTWLQRAFLAAVAGWHVGSGGEPFAVGSVSGGRRRDSAFLKRRERRDARPRISAIARRRLAFRI